MLDRLKLSRIHLKEKPELQYSLLLLFTSLLERAWILINYQPVAFSDTYGSYFRLAGALARGGLHAFDGTRVPGYPLVIAVFQEDEQSIWLFQLMLGLLITQLLFWISWLSFGDKKLGFILGLLYNLIPGQFLFESALLSETLTAFLLLFAFLLLIFTLDEKHQKRQYLYALLLGITSCLPGLVRPLFFPLTVWFLLFVLLKKTVNLRDRLIPVLLFAMGPLVIQGGWLIYMYSSYGMVSPTTMGGYSLVQHTGAFFELLPQDTTGIRDTYVELRDARIQERGVQTNTIWDAIPALAEVSGLNFNDLSREMKSLSIQLIREHPDLYLESVIEGWISFWKAPVYWDSSALSGGQRLISLLAFFGRIVCISANGLFLIFSVLAILWRQVRHLLKADVLNLAILGFIWLTSILQTLFDHGDNPRFLMPLQMLVVLLVLRFLRSYSFKRKLEVGS